jgi:hypothetical protein
MKRLISTQSLAVVAVALGAFAAASSAHARSDVQFSIGVQVPGFYVQAAPVYVRPAPVYYYDYAPVHYGRFNDGVRHGGQQWQRRGPYGDLDRDGIANRYDRDRDGDGVSNRFDRLPDNPYRRHPR